jgi:hypothetical protein
LLPLSLDLAMSLFVSAVLRLASLTESLIDLGDR